MKTVRLLPLVIFLSVSFTNLRAQLDPEWTNTYTTPDTAYMNVIGLLDAGNGNVTKVTMVTKHILSQQHNRLLIQKITSGGALLWDEEYVHPLYDQFSLYGCGRDAAGNLYLAGQLTVSQSDAQWFVVSFDAAGQPRWNRTVVENSFSSGYARELVADASGNIYVSGYVNSGGQSYGVIVKYDANGNELWVKKEANHYSYGVEMLLAANGDLVACDGAYEITRFSPSGNVLWSTPDTAAIVYVTPSMAEGSDGSIYAVSFLGFNYSLKKLSAAGNFEWNIQNFSEYLAFGDNTVKVVADQSGNVYVAGVNSTALDYETAVFKFDAAGNELWRQTFQTGLADINLNDIHDILVLPTGNPVISGFMYSVGLYHTATLLLDAGSGNVSGIDSSTAHLGGQIIMYNSSGLFVAGTGNYETHIFHYGSTVSIDEAPLHGFQAEVYPNPAVQSVSIKADAPLQRFELKNVSGRLLKTGVLTSSHVVTLDDVAAGTYFLVIYDTQGTYRVKKIIKR